MTAKFDSVIPGEVTIDFIQRNPLKQPLVRVKAAFINTNTGATHGWTNKQTWSAEVFSKLEELRQVLEAELRQDHFEDAAVKAKASSRGLTDGLGEFLSDEGENDAPSV